MIVKYSPWPSSLAVPSITLEAPVQILEGSGVIHINPANRGEPAREAPESLKEVAVIRGGGGLDQHCLLHSIVLHLSQNYFNGLIYMERGVNVGVDNSHSNIQPIFSKGLQRSKGLGLPTQK